MRIRIGDQFFLRASSNLWVQAQSPVRVSSQVKFPYEDYRFVSGPYAREVSIPLVTTSKEARVTFFAGAQTSTIPPIA